MTISVRVKTRAVRSSVEQVGERAYVVSVTCAPVDGKANEAVCALLARHFDIPKSAISIRKGFSSTNKIIDISV